MAVASESAPHPRRTDARPVARGRVGGVRRARLPRRPRRRRREDRPHVARDLLPLLRQQAGSVPRARDRSRERDGRARRRVPVACPPNGDGPPPSARGWAASPTSTTATGAVIQAWTEAEISDSEFGRIGGNLVREFIARLAAGIRPAAPDLDALRPRRPRSSPMIERTYYLFVSGTPPRADRDVVLDTLAGAIYAGVYGASGTLDGNPPDPRPLTCASVLRFQVATASRRGAEYHRSRAGARTITTRGEHATSRPTARGRVDHEHRVHGRVRPRAAKKITDCKKDKKLNDEHPEGVRPVPPR